MRWAIVIGIDEYGSEEMGLSGAVTDALRFRDWVTAADGGGVPPANLRLLLGGRADDERCRDAVTATKDNIVTAINDVVVAADPQPAERLYFYFSGHGITARIAHRDESALVTPGFDELHTDHSLAVRSIAEHLETTPFDDQFLFIDACRDVPWREREFEIGRWPVPRRRDPGVQPVQQFILYATSPGRVAHEVGWLGEAEGAFTGALMEALAGEHDAKAWSWERNVYEVRWERLAGYVNKRMTARAEKDRPPEVPAREWAVQIPQDTGARGVAGRDRDVAVVSYASGRFSNLALTVELAADAEYGDAEISVLDALGEPVVRALGVTGASQAFRLPPRTYAVRATTTAPAALVGSFRAPVDLYRDASVPIELRPPATSTGGTEVVEQIGAEDMDAAGREQPPGTIEVRGPDRLSVAEISDEAGGVVALGRAGTRLRAKPGFYRVRHIGPEVTKLAGFVALSAGEDEPVVLPAEPPEPFVAELAQALGGSVDDDYVRPLAGDDPAAWVLPATVVAAGVAGALRGRTPAGLGVREVRAALGDALAGVAVFAVGGEPAQAAAAAALRVSVWPVGGPVPAESTALESSPAGVAGTVRPVRDPLAHWVALAPAGGTPTVVAVPVLAGRLATLVVQIDRDRTRLFQYHPPVAAGAAARSDVLRRVELLERMLVAGRVDAAEPLADEVAEAAADDPFGALVAGYVLLRLGRHERLEALAAAIVAAAPGLSDGYVLRGEHAARAGMPQAAAQAFTDAVGAGIPAFGEGLTRLIEGLRSTGFSPPRVAIVRHVFQRHARGSMWAEFTPRRGLEPGRPVISAADLGIEA